MWRFPAKLYMSLSTLIDKNTNIITQTQVFKSAIVTELSPLQKFYLAEAYHQNFMARNPLYPYVVLHDAPKVRQLKKQFPDIYVN